MTIVPKQRTIYGLGSKVGKEQLMEFVEKILQYSLEEKKTNFTETIEMQITLKNYDPQKDKRFSGSVALPMVPRPRLKICLLATEKDFDRGTEVGLDVKSQDELKSWKKNKKKVKKLAHAYDAFLCSAAIIRQIPRILGPGLNKAGKFPTSLGATEDVASKVDFLKRSVKFQMKKVLTVNSAVANVAMTPDEIATNILTAINFLVSLLKKGWQNIKVIYLKSTMGPSHKLY